MTEKDIDYEGREKAYMDIDRMVNEGLAGGHVYEINKQMNIEEARDVTKEAPPNQN